eukprot:TRINITY_DN6126_c0_g1_i2.p1 TRINITY_DN6126_c0_g1~~TRINITY_DN6126_c0_g1_i2.p1  ORF type:complete len:233 (+),score=74.71 TRINITY_DN6126_c0_g1_i2:76-774(+)
MSDQSSNTTRPKGDKDIQLYSLATPNGIKIAWFLEEAGLEYDAHTINIGKNEQFQPWFLQISPNNRIPAIVDEKPEGVAGPVGLFESGAILQYLAEKYHSKFLPSDVLGRAATLQWLNWQMGGLGPMTGQFGHFIKYAPNSQPAEKLEYGQKRYGDEARRLFGVLDKQLEGKQYVTGDEITIADFAIAPWLLAPTKFYGKPELFSEYKNVAAYLERITARPAFQKALTLTPF